MNIIYKLGNNELGRDSTIHIYANRTYNSGDGDECKYIDRSNSIGVRELREKLRSNDDARGESTSPSTILSRNRVSVTISEGSEFRSAISCKYNSRTLNNGIDIGLYISNDDGRGSMTGIECIPDIHINIYSGIGDRGGVNTKFCI